MPEALPNTSHTDSRTLEGNDNSLILFVGEHVPSQTIILPSERRGVIESESSVEPGWLRGRKNVGITTHLGQIDHSSLICKIWPWNNDSLP